jgi:surface antigen
MRAGLALLGLLMLPIGSAAETLDQSDRAFRDEAVQDALNAAVGQAVPWRNPANGHWGDVTTTHETDNARVCRELAESWTIKGQTSHGVVTGCLASDLSWELVPPVDAAPVASVPAALPPSPDISADPPQSAAPPVGILVRPSAPETNPKR